MDQIKSVQFEARENSTPFRFSMQLINRTKRLVYEVQGKSLSLRSKTVLVDQQGVVRARLGRHLGAAPVHSVTDPHGDTL